MAWGHGRMGHGRGTPEPAHQSGSGLATTVRRHRPIASMEVEVLDASEGRYAKKRGCAEHTSGSYHRLIRCGTIFQPTSRLHPARTLHRIQCALPYKQERRSVACEV